MTTRTAPRFERDGSPVKFEEADAKILSQCLPTETRRPILAVTLVFARHEGDVLKTTLHLDGTRISVSFAHNGDLSMLGKRMVYLVNKRDVCHAEALSLTVEQARCLRKFRKAMGWHDDRAMIIDAEGQLVEFLRDVTRTETTKARPAASPQVKAPAPQKKPESSQEAMTAEACVERLYAALHFPELEQHDDSEVISEVKRAQREKRPTRTQLRRRQRKAKASYEKAAAQETTAVTLAPTTTGLTCERLTYSPFARLGQAAVR